MRKMLNAIPALVLVCGLGAAAPAFSKDMPSKGKGKGAEHSGTKGKHGRDAGELPYGLERYSEKNGELPSGLQKKKDDQGQLTRGLDQGGKKVKSPTKGKNGFK